MRLLFRCYQPNTGLDAAPESMVLWQKALATPRYGKLPALPRKLPRGARAPAEVPHILCNSLILLMRPAGFEPATKRL
jgi:hypothetical protein